MKNLLIFCLLFVSSVVFGQSTEVNIPFGKYSIQGTYLKANKPNGIAVLIIAGSGATDRNCNNAQMKSNAYKYLAEHLATKGISSLRYDKLGVGGSRMEGMKESDFIFSDNMKVAETVYRFLKKQKKVKRIVIAGHSEGSLIGMVSANNMKAYKYISLAGPGYPADEILRTQFGNSIPKGPLQDLSIAYVDTLKKGGVLTDVQPMLKGFFREGMFPYLTDWFKYDPRIEIAKLKMPVLILQGDNDIQVSNDNLEVLAKAKPNAKHYLAKGISHILKEAPTDRQDNFKSYNSPDKDIAEEVKKVIIDFILD